MSVEEHPEFRIEKKRLKATKQYIQAILKSTDQNRKTYKQNIRQAMEELDYLDSSQSYINVITNSKFMEMAERNVESLKKVQDHPYFCRIDFKPEEVEKAEALYIGKVSLYREDNHQPVIVDWRSPIANVYYEGRIGETSYTTGSMTVHGELTKKRNYRIEDGILKDFADVDITARDELLQASLEGHASSTLKDIVATIQAEQNQVIRADMYRPLIVQGAAGSGKTTIALHRIAYFIYTYAKTFDPDDFMIIAPSDLFINYISEVLPELGVEQVKQSTFVNYVFHCLGKRIQLVNENDKLLHLIDAQNEQDAQIQEMVKWSSAYKGSLDFKAVLQQYVNQLIEEAVPEQSFTLGNTIIYSSEKIKKLFKKDYRYLPLAERVKQIRKVLTNHLRLKIKELRHEIAESYDDKMEGARYRYAKEPDQRKKVIIQLMDEKEERLRDIDETPKTLLNSYMKKFPQWDVLKCYTDFFEHEICQHLLQQQINNIDKVTYLCSYSLKLLKDKKIEFEDTAALLFLQHHLKGLSKNKKVKNVVMDEAQDFSVFQFDALKTILDTEMFTILGDLAQGIHSYRGLRDWNQLKQQVFDKLPCQLVTLEQSYRTTIEIMDLANQVIGQLNEPGVTLAKPVIRHGEKPSWRKCTEDQALISELINKMTALQGKYSSITLVCKSLHDSKKLYKSLEDHQDFIIKLIREGDSLESKAIHIVPSYLVKGLEFDAVVIVNLNDRYEKNELDTKLLYVAMTRPMHHLSIISREESLPILDHVSPKYLEDRRL